LTSFVHNHLTCLFALQSSTRDGEGSPSSKAALLRAAKRRKSASKPVEDSQPRVLAPGQDLKLLTRAAKDGGIVHAIQPMFVPEIIARCGMRWWNAQFNPQITNVLRELVVKYNLGCFGEVYDKLREVRPASELDVLRVLRTSHQHTSKEHHYRMNMLALKLFRDTVDPAVNYVKSKVFGIEDGKPILGADHPLMKELMAQTSGRVLMELPFLCFTSDHLRFLQMGRRRFFSRISAASSLEKAPSWGSAAKRVRKCSTFS
jgi:hypothetical protein